MPLSSVECERGFSCMNAKNTSVRSQLSVQTLNSLISIKVNGPTPQDFHPESYAKRWLKSGHHSSSDKQTGKKSKAESDKTGSQSSMSALYTLNE